MCEVVVCYPVFVTLFDNRYVNELSTSYRNAYNIQYCICIYNKHIQCYNGGYEKTRGHPDSTKVFSRPKCVICNINLINKQVYSKMFTDVLLSLSLSCRCKKHIHPDKTFSSSKFIGEFSVLFRTCLLYTSKFEVQSNVFLCMTYTCLLYTSRCV